MVLGAGTVYADGPAPNPNLTAQWWPYIVSIPPGINPGLDATGTNCGLGQRGPIWFLVGTFSTGPAVRSCSIPAGEALLVPVVNYVNINTPNVCGSPNQTVAELRAQSAPIVDGATNMSVEVDQHPIEDMVRVKSSPFAVSIPADNIFNSPGCQVPAAIYSPAVDDGYYVLLNPLKVGTHTLHIHGEIPSIQFVVDVTYNLTIVPVQLK